MPLLVANTVIQEPGEQLVHAYVLQKLKYQTKTQLK